MPSPMHSQTISRVIKQRSEAQAKDLCFTDARLRPRNRASRLHPPSLPLIHATLTTFASNPMANCTNPRHTPATLTTSARDLVANSRHTPATPTTLATLTTL